MTTLKRALLNVHILDSLVVGYYALAPFSLVSVILGRTPVSLISIIIIPMWLFERMSGWKTRPISPAFYIPLLGLAGWASFSLLWTPDPIAGSVAAGSLWLTVLMAMVLIESLPRIWPPAITAFIMSTGIVAFILLVSPSAITEGGRASIGVADQNLTALVLVSGYACTLIQLRRCRSRTAALWFALGGVQLAGALVTGSRTALFAIVATTLATVFFVFLSRARPRSRVPIALFLVVLACAVPLASRWDRLPSRLQSYFTGAGLHGDGARRSIHQSYLHQFNDWGAIGVGYDGDAKYLEQTVGLYKNVHNLYLRIWVELGVPGILLLAALLVYLALRIMRRGTLSWSVPLLLPLVVFSLSLGGLERASIMWVMIALAATAPIRTNTPLLTRGDRPHQTQVQGRRSDSQNNYNTIITKGVDD